MLVRSALAFVLGVVAQVLGIFMFIYPSSWLMSCVAIGVLATLLYILFYVMIHYFSILTNIAVIIVIIIGPFVEKGIFNWPMILGYPIGIICVIIIAVMAATTRAPRS